jgi:glycosyltransferase involved in cell wall biosynthesis
VHVSVDTNAAHALEAYIGPDANRVQLHQRRAPGRGDGAIELLLWRGRVRFLRSRKLALVADLTTRLYPELHTPFTVREFDGYLRYAIKHAHGIVTVSDHSRRDIISNLNVFPASVYRIGNRVNAAFEHPSFDPDVPRSYGLTGPYLLVVGTIEPRKNLRRLVQAFERLRQQGHGDLTLAIAGPPGWDEHFLTDLAASPARDGIVYLGFVPLEQLPSLYHYARAVTYPSLYEGFGLPVLEAMCCSSVVVASRSSSLPEILGDGIQFDPYCVDAIASALAAALRLTVDEDTVYRHQCRERARALLKTWSAEPALPGL